jgi:diguanylate cyclase (GGDEF)-like protein/PAS domain S-box-containing protein
MKMPRITKAQLMTELETMRRRLERLEAAEAEYLRVADALRESEEKYRILLDESSDPIFMFNNEGEYRYVNKAFADGVGKRLEEIIGNKIWDVFSKDEADKRYAAVKWVFENGKTKVIEVCVPRSDGDRYYITTVKPILDEVGTVLSVICISKEITERKRMEQELQYLSTHDTLTGLYNRNFFEAELTRLQSSRLFPVSILVCDMDNLKMVNDQKGHQVGDALIRDVAEELKRFFRAKDIIARIGGDEFAVLLPGMDESSGKGVVDRLRTNLQNHVLSLSLGLATGGEDSLLTDIMRLADDRMYQDKLMRKRGTTDIRNRIDPSL